eukprot:620722-Pelagomonas_calceolata.AAC.3
MHAAGSHKLSRGRCSGSGGCRCCLSVWPQGVGLGECAVWEPDLHVEALLGLCSKMQDIEGTQREAESKIKEPSNGGRSTPEITTLRRESSDTGKHYLSI